MRFRRPLGPAVVVLLSALAGSAGARQEKEPTYDGKALSHWLKELRGTDAKDRRWAAFTLSGEIGPEGKAAVPALTEALKDEDKDVRSGAAEALGQIGPGASAAAPALVKALKDEDAAVGAAAVRALSGIRPRDKAVVAALADALKDRATRAAAAEVLGHLGPEAKVAAPALLEALKDEDSGTRAAVAIALGALGPDGKAAVPALTAALKDEDPLLRANAAAALGLIGPEARAAFPALRTLLKDEASDARRMAVWATHQVDPKAAKEAAVPRPVTLYHAFLGNSAQGFDRDDVVEARYWKRGEDAVHALVLWVNGDPVEFYGTNEMRVVVLNHWLRPGKNELTLTGKHGAPVYVKVGRRPGASPIELSGKRKFPGPGAEGPAEPLVFPVELLPELPAREELSDKPEDRARYEKEIRALLAEVKILVEKKKTEEVGRLLFGGPLLYAEAAYGWSADEVLEPLAHGVGAKLTVADEDRPLRLIFGKRGVLAYAEPKDAGRGRHLLEARRDQNTVLGFGPFLLARVGGKWVFWHTDVAPVG